MPRYIYWNGITYDTTRYLKDVKVRIPIPQLEYSAPTPTTTVSKYY